MTSVVASSVPETRVPELKGRHGKFGSWDRLVAVPIVSSHSCLFAALDLLLFQNRVGVAALRQLAASTIEADPDTFNDVTLEQPREAYIQWIQCSNSWGGYIELVALSQALKVQFLVVDISSGRQDSYGDDSLGRRIYLLYHGVHYDAVVGEVPPATIETNGSVCSPPAGRDVAENAIPDVGAPNGVTSMDSCAALEAEAIHISIFDPSDSEALKQVLTLAAELRLRNSQGQARRDLG